MKSFKTILAILPIGYLIMSYLLITAGSPKLACLMIFMAIVLTLALFGRLLNN